MIHKLYFLTESDDMAYSRGWFDRYMKEHYLTGIEVFEAVSERVGGGIFWCKKHEFCGDNAVGPCGTKNCKDYIARNGKAGVCKFHSGWLYTKGRKVKLKLI